MKIWLRREEQQAIYFENGLNSILDVFMKFCYKTQQPEEPSACEIFSASDDSERSQSFSQKVLARQLVQAEQDDPEFNVTERVDLIRVKNMVSAEITRFSEIIKSRDFRHKNFSTRQFWLKYETELPNLFVLAAILLNISASSCHIERYFSICRIVCALRSLAMTDELVETRSLLKANRQLLQELSED
jgi:hypothetical protein